MACPKIKGATTAIVNGVTYTIDPDESLSYYPYTFKREKGKSNGNVIVKSTSSMFKIPFSDSATFNLDTMMRLCDGRVQVISSSKIYTMEGATAAFEEDEFDLRTEHRSIIFVSGSPILETSAT